MKGITILILAMVITACGGVAPFKVEEPSTSSESDTTPDTPRSHSVTLGWNANAEPSLAGYKIYYGTSSQNYLQAQGQGIDVELTDSPNQPRFTIENLSSGQTYYFSVTAYDEDGQESSFSDEASVRIE